MQKKKQHRMGPKPQHTPKERAEMLAMYADPTISMEEISKAYNLSQSRIYQIAKKAGIQRSKRHRTAKAMNGQHKSSAKRGKTAKRKREENKERSRPTLSMSMDRKAIQMLDGIVSRTGMSRSRVVEILIRHEVKENYVGKLQKRIMEEA